MSYINYKLVCINLIMWSIVTYLLARGEGQYSTILYKVHFWSWSVRTFSLNNNNKMVAPNYCLLLKMIPKTVIQPKPSNWLYWTMNDFYMTRIILFFKIIFYNFFIFFYFSPSHRSSYLTFSLFFLFFYLSPYSKNYCDIIWK